MEYQKMEYQKINNLLGSTPDKVSKFIAKKWIEVNNQSGKPYITNKQIRFTTSMLRSHLCDYSDAYIVVKGVITVTNPNNDAYNKKLALKNDAPFISCISKIDGELIENAGDLDIVMPIYNLLEYCKNYRKTTGSLLNYYRDEPCIGKTGTGIMKISYSITGSKSFDYKTSIAGKLDGTNIEEDDIKIAIPLKYLGNFWRSLNMPLINCEISLILSW